MTAVPAGRLPKEKSTIALYHFDEGRGDILKDSSGNNHHGKIVGAKWVSSSSVPSLVSDYELEFDGVDDYVDLPSLTCDTGKPITLEGWVTPASVGAHSHILVLHGETTVSIQQSEGSWHGLRLRQGGLQMLAAPNAPPTSGQPRHLALVWDGTRQRLFVDGKGASHESGGGANQCGASGALLGCVRLTDSDPMLRCFFGGRIDEVRVSKSVRYEKDFTPSQHFQTDKDTLALYHFDEGRGDVLKDSSGNNHHGKIVGAKWAKADGTTSQREAIDWLLSMGAQVLVGPGGATEDIKSYAEYVSKNQPVSVVSLNNAAVTDNDLERLLIFPDIFSVNLICNQLGDAGLSHLANLPKLTSLSLTGSQVTDRGLLPLLKRRALRVLHVGNNPLSAESLKTIGQLTELTELGLEGLPLTDASLAELEKLPNLTDLRIVGCKPLTDACGSTLARLPKLSSLRVDNTELGDEGVRKLSESKSLSNMSLYGTKITDASVPHLSRIKSLTHLGAQETGLTAAGVKQLAAALPQCLIASNHGNFEPSKSIVLIRDKQPAGEFATLAEAFAQLGEDNVIEIHGNGPFAVGALEASGKKSLTMKSAPGYRARVVATAHERNLVFNCTGTQFVTVEGIEFVSHAPSVWFAGTNMPEQVWDFRNCWLVSVNSQTPNGITFGGAKLRLEDCLLIQRNVHDSLSLYGQVPQQLELVNCVAFLPDGRPIYQTRPGNAEFEINHSFRLERNTIYAELHLNLANSEKKKSTLIEPEGNLFLQPALGLTGGQIDSTELRWKGRDNAYATGVVTNWQQPTKPVIPLPSWIGDLKRDEQGSREVDAATPGWAALENADLDQFAKSVLDLAKTMHATHKAGADVSKWPAVGTVALKVNALEFDGQASHVELPMFPLDATGPLTIEAWFTAQPGDKPNANDVDAKTDAIWSLQNPQSKAVANFILDRANGGWWFGAGIERLVRTVYYSFTRVDNRADLYGVRHHAAFVREGDEVKIYVDGVPLRSGGTIVDADKTTPDPSIKFQEVEKFFLGAAVSRDGKNLTRFFHGSLDEFRISKSVRYTKPFTPEPIFSKDAETVTLYHFDEGQGDVLTDSSGNNHHGKIVGAKWVPAGNRSAPTSPLPIDRHALSFDGVDDYVDLPTFPPTESFTVEAICTPLRYAHAQVVSSRGFYLSMHNDRPSWSLVGRVANNQFVNITCPQEIASGQRVTLAGLYDGKNLRLFVDGKLIGDTPSDRPASIFRIGSVTGPPNNFFPGTIEAVRITRGVRYDSDHSIDEPWQPDESTLVLYRFDEGSGDVLKDSSGNNRHGKIVGAKWVKADGGPVINNEPDRSAAKYVLSVGGTVQINDIPQEYTDVRELPKSRFRLTSIMLHGRTQVSAAGLAACRGCQHLTRFQLSASARVGDAGLEPFRQCKKLKSLALSGTGVTDVGLDYFSGCRDLTGLSFHENLVTDLGLAIFRDCQKLESLDMAHLRMTEKGLGYFQDCRNLQSLSLSNTPLGDEAIAQLKSFPKLKSLSFTNEVMVTNAGLASLSSLKGLTFLNLTATQVDDVGVEPLKKLTKLTSLHLNGTKLTAAGLAQLKKALPDCKIEADIKP